MERLFACCLLYFGMVRGVTFDVFGTLFDWRVVRGVVESVFDRCGVDMDVDGFITLWRSKQLFYSQVNTMLGRRHMSFREATRRALVYTLTRYGVALDEHEVEELTEAWDNLSPFPEVGECLVLIRERGLLMAPLSNGDKVSLNKLVSKLPKVFDDIFSAEDAGVYKPHPRIYEQASKKWGLKPADILHVAGAPFDVAGAKSFGMMTVWVNRTGEIYDEFEEKPDFVVRDFRELVNVVGKLSRG